MRVGPGKDIVGTWAKLARERGMRFAVSNDRPMPGTGTSPPMATIPRGRAPGSVTPPATLTKAQGRGKMDGRSAAALHRSSHADARRHPHPRRGGAWHAATDGLWTEVFRRTATSPATGCAAVRIWRSDTGPRYGLFRQRRPAALQTAWISPPGTTIGRCSGTAGSSTSWSR
ncbi:hypothetical protein AB5I41_27535 [Sphingomonas sp. MMS24-JH45]